ncbi:MAG TPA: Na/Pi cotransporter family protein [Bauldia sp.]|nr:Na/Pi cotransporter family protein [Bauldia sp.]
MGSRVLLDLMGGVALMLWGLHMVQSGILRAFGADLRHFLGRALSNRFSALAAGFALTGILQSSTATGLMTASFAAQGLVALVPALAIMLGANIGTTLIVQVLAFDVAALAPLLFAGGLIAFRLGAGSRIKDIGRIAIGFGLVLLALHTVIDTLAPAESAPAVKVVLDAITGDPVMCVLVAALFTWAAHSSVAAVLVVMSLAYSQFITPEAAIAMVLGANLGSAVNPLIEGVKRDDPASYRLPVGNLVNRLAGLIVVLPFVGPLAHLLSGWLPDPARMTATFHIVFNVATSAVFLPLLDPLARLMARLFPEKKLAADPAAPRYLDDSALDTPSLALADAAREVLHMGDLVQDMLEKVMAALMTNNRALVAEASRTDDAVDKLDEAIKLYVTKLTRRSLDEREARRAMEIISFSINLEAAGDIIDKNLTELAAKKIKRKLQFSPEGATEIAAFHRRIVESLRIGLSVFMSGDAVAAKKLIAEKAELRNAELAAAEHHIERLREGRRESMETTSLHLDVLRDLKRVHSHIVSVAYPALNGGETSAAAEHIPASLVELGARPARQ